MSRNVSKSGLARYPGSSQDLKRKQEAKKDVPTLPQFSFKTHPKPAHQNKDGGLSPQKELDSGSSSLANELKMAAKRRKQQAGDKNDSRSSNEYIELQHGSNREHTGQVSIHDSHTDQYNHIEVVNDNHGDPPLRKPRVRPKSATRGPRPIPRAQTSMDFNDSRFNERMPHTPDTSARSVSGGRPKLGLSLTVPRPQSGGNVSPRIRQGSSRPGSGTRPASGNRPASGDRAAQPRLSASGPMKSLNIHRNHPMLDVGSIDVTKPIKSKAQTSHDSKAATSPRDNQVLQRTEPYPSRESSPREPKNLPSLLPSKSMPSYHMVPHPPPSHRPISRSTGAKDALGPQQNTGSRLYRRFKHLEAESQRGSKSAGRAENRTPNRGSQNYGNSTQTGNKSVTKSMDSKTSGRGQGVSNSHGNISVRSVNDPDSITVRSINDSITVRSITSEDFQNTSMNQQSKDDMTNAKAPQVANKQSEFDFRSSFIEKGPVPAPRKSKGQQQPETTQESSDDKMAASQNTPRNSTPTLRNNSNVEKTQRSSTPTHTDHPNDQDRYYNEQERYYNKKGTTRNTTPTPKDKRNDQSRDHNPQRNSTDGYYNKIVAPRNSTPTLRDHQPEKGHLAREEAPTPAMRYPPMSRTLYTDSENDTDMYTLSSDNDSAYDGRAGRVAGGRYSRASIVSRGSTLSRISSAPVAIDEQDVSDSSEEEDDSQSVTLSVDSDPNEQMINLDELSEDEEIVRMKRLHGNEDVSGNRGRSDREQNTDNYYNNIEHDRQNYQENRSDNRGRSDRKRSDRERGDRERSDKERGDRERSDKERSNRERGYRDMQVENRNKYSDNPEHNSQNYHQENTNVLNDDKKSRKNRPLSERDKQRREQLLLDLGSGREPAGHGDGDGEPAGYGDGGRDYCSHVCVCRVCAEMLQMPDDSFYETIERSPEYDNNLNTKQMSDEDLARQQEEWRKELFKLEEEIHTLQTVLSAKVRCAGELKRKLGVTPYVEFKQDLDAGVKAIKDTDASHCMHYRDDQPKLEEEIATLRSVLNAKIHDANELKKNLGLTTMKEIKTDLRYGLQSIKESPTYKKSSESLFYAQQSITNSHAYQFTNEKLTNMNESIHGSQAYQKTTDAFKTFGAWSTRKLGDARNSNTFKSFEEKMGGAYSNVKTKMTGSRSENSFQELKPEGEGGRPAGEEGEATPESTTPSSDTPAPITQQK